ncbi:MAG: S41 family peptidase [Chitinophagaceae bacterium]
MKHLVLIGLTLVFPLSMLFAQPVAPAEPADRIFSPAQLKEDFSFLRKVLEETHPGLYRYTPQPVIQQKMDTLASLLNKDMDYYGFYALLAGLLADIRCSHTYIVPQKDINSYMTNIKTIPFEFLSLSSGRLYVTLSGITGRLVEPGYELMSINGRPVSAVLEQIYRHTWSDGYIRSAKVHQATGIRFGLLYYLSVERPDSFRLEFFNREGKPVGITVVAQPYKEYSKIYLQNPVNKRVLDIYLPRNKKDNKESWRLEWLNEPYTACLVFRNFGGGNSTEAAAKKMQSFMEKSLSTLKKKNIRNLIIDLRSNSGGWDAQGVELMKYLVNDSVPFRYFRHAHTITDSSEFFRFSDLSAVDMANIRKELIPKADGTFEVSEEYNEERKIQQPKPNRFKGNVYFLVNGGTASAAAEFAAIAYSHNTGIFVGSETGGAYEGSNGGSFLHFSLPNSGFYIGSPLIYSENAVDPPAEKGRGTIPHHQVASSVDDVLKGVDAQMEFVLKLIRGTR